MHYGALLELYSTKLRQDSEFKASLGYMRLCQKKKKAKEKLKGSVKDYYTEKQAAYFTFTNLPLISGSSPSFLLSSIRIS